MGNVKPNDVKLTEMLNSSGRKEQDGKGQSDGSETYSQYFIEWTTESEYEYICQAIAKIKKDT